METDTVLSRIARHATRRLVSRYERWRAVHLPSRIPSLTTSGVGCQWLSTNPPILLAAYWLDERYRTMHSLEPVFERLGRRSAHFFYLWCWHIDEPDRVRVVRRMELTHRRRFPGHRFTHLCNSPLQLDAFRAAGLTAILCNHNCLLDERAYYPIPGVPKRFDAVYNARFKSYKRHHLAARVDSLALIYDQQPAVDDAGEVAAVRRRMGHAHCFNHDEDGGYRALDTDEVRQSLNACRVGLCLSAVEGAMFASMEYLLCGLPVVSTESLGGRDVFFDQMNAQIVDATPDAVRAGVAAMVDRGLAPDMIRESVLARVRDHRRRLQAAVQAVYDEEHAGRRFVDEWPQLFYNRLHRFQTHAEILGQLEPATGGGAGPGSQSE